MSQLGEQLYEIICPHCKTKFSKSLQWLKQSDRDCKECKVTFKSDEFMREIEEIERKLSSIREKIEKMG
ncbi:hypothetical protein BCL69_10905 [Nitrosomonas communis]|uniref:Uncharacterized protein n=1 Tax=Nitrosomonas communis TaxID=44574 RepID=A0A5D3Y7A8_9PROT|nr:hypothetical protein BCL69_10905 [Nitrosomonas communis]